MFLSPGQTTEIDMEFESNLKLFHSEVKEIELIRQLAENLSVLLSRGERLHIKSVNVSECTFEISRDICCL